MILPISKSITVERYHQHSTVRCYSDTGETLRSKGFVRGDLARAERAPLWRLAQHFFSEFKRFVERKFLIAGEYNSFVIASAGFCSNGMPTICSNSLSLYYSQSGFKSISSIYFGSSTYFHVLVVKILAVGVQRHPKDSFIFFLEWNAVYTPCQKLKLRLRVLLLVHFSRQSWILHLCSVECL